MRVTIVVTNDDGSAAAETVIKHLTMEQARAIMPNTSPPRLVNCQNVAQAMGKLISDWFSF